MEADVGNLTTCSKKSKNYYTTPKTTAKTTAKLPDKNRMNTG